MKKKLVLKQQGGSNPQRKSGFIRDTRLSKPQLHNGATALDKQVFPGVNSGTEWLKNWLSNRKLMNDYGVLKETDLPHMSLADEPLWNSHEADGWYDHINNYAFVHPANTRAHNKHDSPQQLNDIIASTAVHELTHASQNLTKAKPRDPLPALSDEVKRKQSRTNAWNSVVDNVLNATPGRIIDDYNYYQKADEERREKHWIESHPVINPMKQSLEIIKNTPKRVTDPYLTEPGEIHSRLMEWRRYSNTKPNETITPEIYNQRKKAVRERTKDYSIDQLYKTLDDKQIINLLNKTVSVDPPTNQYQITAQQGGSINQPVIVEQGEIARDINGNLVQVHPDAPSHDDGVLAHATGSRSAGARRGGVETSMLESVLSDSQSQINSGERKNNSLDAQIKIKPSEAKLIAESLGLEMKITSSLSPSKLFLNLQTARDKQAKKLTIKTRDKESAGKIFQDSQRVNTIQQAALPDDHALYDLVFGIQESMKQLPVEEDTMQRGGKVKLSTQGYKRNSPDRNEPYLQIPGNSITMEGVDHDVMLYGDGGEIVHATPDNDYVLPNSSSVLEVPLAQQGYNGAEQQKRYNQFFSPQLQNKYKQVEAMYNQKYPGDQGAKKLAYFRDTYGSTLPEDFKPGDMQRTFPEFDESYQQYQQKLLNAKPEELTDFVHDLSGVKNPIQLLGVKTPEGISKWDMVKLGMKIKKDRSSHTFQQGGRKLTAAEWDALEQRQSVGRARTSISPETAAMLIQDYPGLAGEPGTYQTPVLPEEYTDLTVYPGKKPTKAQVKQAQKKKLALKKSTPVIKQAKQAGVAKQSGIDYSKFLPDPTGDSTVPMVAPASYAPGVITQNSLNRAFTPVTRDPAIVEGVDTVPTNLQQQIAQKYVDDVNPFKPKAYQFAGDLFNLMSASTRAPGYLQQLTPEQLHLERVNGTASTQGLYNAYQGANGSIPDPSTQIGRAQGVAQYSAFLDSLNSLNGNLNAQNVQIANQEEQYNNQLNNQTEQTNANLRDQFYVRDLQTEEARRQQISSTINSVTSKLAQAKQAEANYNLFKSTYAPRYKVGENGKIVLDKSAGDVSFGTPTLTDNPNTKTTTRTTKDAQGNVTGSSITQQELDMLTSNPSYIQRLRSQGFFKR